MHSPFSPRTVAAIAFVQAVASFLVSGAAFLFLATEDIYGKAADVVAFVWLTGIVIGVFFAAAGVLFVVLASNRETKDQQAGLSRSRWPAG